MARRQRLSSAACWTHHRARGKDSEATICGSLAGAATNAEMEHRRAIDPTTGPLDGKARCARR